jgi:hypothetical protein
LVKDALIPYGYAPADGQPTSMTLIEKQVREPHMMSEVNFLGNLTQAALMEEDNWNDGDDDDNESEFEVCDSQDTNHKDANVSFQDSDDSDDAGHRKKP